MTDIIKKTTITRNGDSQTASVSQKSKVSKTETTERLIYFFLGLMEVLLVFRLLFKVAAANSSSSFVSWIYGLTNIMILPFNGIFPRSAIPGTGSVFEPATLTAILVYAVLAWGITSLLQTLSGEEQDS